MFTVEKPKHITSLATRGILIHVDMSNYGGTKSDSKMGREESAAKGAKQKVLNISHQLFADDPDFHAISVKRQSIDSGVKLRTYDWAGSLRYLFSENIASFRQWFDQQAAEYLALRDVVCDKLENKISHQAFVRGPLFNRDHYPTVDELREKISISLHVMNVPEGDFRVQVAQDLANDMMQSVQNQYEQYAKGFAERQIEDLVKVMRSLSECCDVQVKQDAQGKTKVARSRLHTATIEKALDYINRFKTENLIGDQKLEDARAALELAFNGVTPDVLKNSDTLRSKVKDEVDQILSRF